MAKSPTRLVVTPRRKARSYQNASAVSKNNMAPRIVECDTSTGECSGDRGRVFNIEAPMSLATVKGQIKGVAPRLRLEEMSCTEPWARSAGQESILVESLLPFLRVLDCNAECLYQPRGVAYQRLW